MVAIVDAEREGMARVRGAGWSGFFIAPLACWSVKVSRITFLAVPLTVLLLAPVAARRWPIANWRWRAPSPQAAMVLLVPLLVSAGAVLAAARGNFECLPIGRQDPQGLARLAATQGPGRVANFFDWGQYAIWHLSPRLKVSWDGRRETHFSETVLRTQRAMELGLPEGDAWLAQVRPEYVWLPAPFRERREWLLKNGYRLDHDTEKSFIAVRGDLPPLSQAEAFVTCMK
jgi:hypothetical protein